MKIKSEKVTVFERKVDTYFRQGIFSDNFSIHFYKNKLNKLLLLIENQNWFKIMQNIISHNL